MRVLIIAERANPEMTSVPLVGWSHAQAIKKVCDAHLVTQIRNRDAIVAAGWVEGKDFTALDTESLDGPLSRLVQRIRGGSNKGWTLVTAGAGLAYYNFERVVWQRFGKRIRAHEFDIVHRITPLSPTIPSLLAKKCVKAKVPFVLGPLNGGLKWPQGFSDVRWMEREWLSYARGLHRLLPGFSSTRKHAAAILIASRDTWAQIPPKYHQKSFYIPENGVDPSRFSLSHIKDRSGPLRIVFVGRLVP